MKNDYAGRPQSDLESVQGTNQTGMREGNERLILTLLRRSAGIPSAEIARRTGLSAQTVSRMIRALEADALILRGEPQRGRVGQPSVPLSLNPEGAFFLGLKVGRRSVELVLTNFMGEILDHAKQVYPYPDVEAVLDFALDNVTAMRARLAPPLQARVAGMGIAMPFSLWNWASHLGVDPARMANWQTRDLRAELAARIDLPIFLQNDATAACSAELVFGDTPRPENFLTFYVAFFIGGGLVLRGSLYTGSQGNAAGIGPLKVPDVDGTSRTLIDLASLATLERSLVAEGVDPGPLWEDAETWAVPPHLLEAWMARAAPALAEAMHAAQSLLDVDAIVLDGWLPRRLLAELVARVNRDFDALDLDGINRPGIVTGSLGAFARPLGAASLPLSARFLVD